MKRLLTLLLIIPCLGLTACGIDIVDAGHTGIKKRFGAVEDKVYPPGLYFYNPLTTDMFDMDNRVQVTSDKSAVYTKDVQQAEISYTLNYALSASASAKIYSTVGWDWEQKLIPQVITGAMKNVMGKWEAIPLVANRDKATADITQSITDGLQAYGIIITKFEITNIDFRDEFETAVENKVVAIQNAEQAKNQTVQVQEQANQRIIAAKADAEAMEIKTAALAKSQSLIMYEAVQKWNGVLPKIVGGNGGNLLNIPPEVLAGQ